MLHCEKKRDIKKMIISLLKISFKPKYLFKPTIIILKNKKSKEETCVEMEGSPYIQ